MEKGQKRLLVLDFCCIFLSFLPEFPAAVNSITSSQSIRDNHTLVSPAQQFELGFFTPANSSLSYLGIWYKYIPHKTIVWVANRDSPLINSTGVLKFTKDGKLVLFNQEGTILWSSNQSKAAKNPVAELLDDGNFVLKEAENNGSSEGYLWQSFDYPSDTLLPGMKLGWNFKMGLNRKLTSWKSSVDPSSGQYTYSVDSRGLPQLVLLQGTRKIFRSGPWFGDEFKRNPVLRSNPVYKPTFVSISSELYYTYEIKDNIASRFVLAPSGLVQHFSWNARHASWNLLFTIQGDQCDTYGNCGSFGSCHMNNNTPICECLTGFEPKSPQDQEVSGMSSGCVRKDSHICGKGEGFKKFTGLKLPDASKYRINLSMSLEECEANCWRNCSCLAFAKLDIRGNGNGCVTWYQELIDIREVSTYGPELYVRVAASELGSDTDTNTKQKHLGLAVALPVASALIIFAMVNLFLVWRRQRKGGEPDNQIAAVRDSSEEYDLELPLFGMDVIEAATHNFSDANKIGQGGFGPVYKGKLPSGKKIAVKRLAESSGQGVREFKNEVILISQLQHRNLVRLLGCCIQGQERMLVYEYMPNSSIDSLIFGQTCNAMIEGAETRNCSLNWQKRYDIIVGIARGLLYLHRDSRLRIIHRDLKPSNVLLDSGMNPRISDFGMARMFGRDQTEAKTKHVVGTYGYMPPEYAIDGHFSFKSDVYSFGVLLLEILSGKKNRGFFHPDHKLNLLGHAWKLWNEGKALELMDPLLENEYPARQALGCIQVGLLCVQQRPEERPTMSSVLLMFCREAVSLPQPGRPGFYSERSFSETDSSSARGVNSYSNDVTITLLEGR